MELPGPPCLGPADSYFYAFWTNPADDQPNEYYDELDATRWSIRCVRKYRDGRLEAHSYGSDNWRDGMPDAAVPPIETINQNPEFRAKEISRAEFEEIWSRAVGRISAA